MSNSLRGSRLVFSEQRLKDFTSPSETLKSIWVSTALALILSLPSLGIFLGLIHLTNNVIIGSLTGLIDLVCFKSGSRTAWLTLR